MTGDRTPLRVAVVAPRPVPFAPGGAERHWDALVRALCEAGHAAELVALDSPESTLPEVLGSYRRFLGLDLSSYDAVVSGKYPSWMVRHPRHVRHLNHPLRGLYDLYPAHLPPPDPSQLAEVARRLADGADTLLDWAEDQARRAGPGWELPGPWARAVVAALDADASSRIAAQAVVSETVAMRPSYQGGLLPAHAPLAVIAPLTDLRPASASAGAHFLTFGRLAREKRFDLAIEAFGRSGVGRNAPEPFELWVVGTGPDESRLRALAARTPGVQLLGHCSDDELATYIASSVAVIATPRDEDYGLVATEAHAAGRPVLTVSDSGGIAEQVGHDAGIVTPPYARMLGAAIARLARDPAHADRLGRAGRDRVAQLSWDPLVRLVEQSPTVGEQSPTTGRRSTAQPGPRPHLRPDPAVGPRLVMLSTFLADPITGGGSRRLRAVAAGLGQRFDMTVIALTNEVDGVRRRILSDGVVQIAVGRSAAHRRADHEMQALAGLPVDDIGASVLFGATPRFAAILDEQLTGAAAVVLAHPFLAPALPSTLSCPVVYDAHNVEIDLKARLLRGRPGARRLMEWCEHAEATALVRASLVSAVSADDLARLCPAGCGHRNLVVPNGVDEHLLGCRPGPGPERSAARSRLLLDLGLAADQRPIVLFVGSSHEPNHEAADHLAELSRIDPELLFVLAGGHSDRPRKGPASLGFFADRDLRRLLLAADVIVNPVAVGSGTNLKLIEALASGTPVVATTIGARGLDDPERVLTLVANDDLLGGIRSVLDRPGPARERAAAGQDLAGSHRWSRVLAPLEAAIGDLVGVRLGP